MPVKFKSLVVLCMLQPRILVGEQGGLFSPVAPNTLLRLPGRSSWRCSRSAQAILSAQTAKTKN